MASAAARKRNVAVLSNVSIGSVIVMIFVDKSAIVAKRVVAFSMVLDKKYPRAASEFKLETKFTGYTS
jgi:hypothetical protein